MTAAGHSGIERKTEQEDTHKHKSEQKKPFARIYLNSFESAIDSKSHTQFLVDEQEHNADWGEKGGAGTAEYSYNPNPKNVRKNWTDPITSDSKTAFEPARGEYEKRTAAHLHPSTYTYTYAQ